MSKLKKSEFLTPEELASRWNDQITTATLTNWRSLKKGPSFCRLGGIILYPVAKVEIFEKENLVII